MNIEGGIMAAQSTGAPAPSLAAGEGIGTATPGINTVSTEFSTIDVGGSTLPGPLSSSITVETLANPFANEQQMPGEISGISPLSTMTRGGIFSSELPVVSADPAGDQAFATIDFSGGRAGTMPVTESPENVIPAVRVAEPEDAAISAEGPVDDVSESELARLEEALRMLKETPDSGEPAKKVSPAVITYLKTVIAENTSVQAQDATETVLAVAKSLPPLILDELTADVQIAEQIEQLAITTGTIPETAAIQATKVVNQTLERKGIKTAIETQIEQTVSVQKHAERSSRNSLQEMKFVKDDQTNVQRVRTATNAAKNIAQKVEDGDVEMITGELIVDEANITPFQPQHLQSELVRGHLEDGSVNAFNQELKSAGELGSVENAQQTISQVVEHNTAVAVSPAGTEVGQDAVNKVIGKSGVIFAAPLK